jgi:phosphoribosylamine--glycine ligase
MKVLVVGSGGREHALCWKFRQSPQLEELYCAPGNPGIARIADPVPIPADETHQLADFAAELQIDLTVVGPELPLTFGIADEFAGRGLALFGPRQQAADLEASKVFAKELMRRHDIPTADFAIAHDAEEARRAAARFGFPVVLKADGLTAGGGTAICRAAGELEAAVQSFFEDRRFGTAGERVVVERFLSGQEVTFLALCDGERTLPIAPTKGYKRLLKNDEGPHTAGMGAHCPAGVLASGAAADVHDRIVRPVVQAMADENRSFVGVLCIDLTLTAEGPRVLEFNVRFGDPDAQAVLLRLENDLLPILAAGAAGRFNAGRLRFRKEASACVVLASKGYPDKPIRGEEIEGLAAAARNEGVEIFHAGTGVKDGRLVAAGGRVIDVCATGPQLRDALKRAYTAAAAIHWPSKILRFDIGREVLTNAAGAAASPRGPGPI